MTLTPSKKKIAFAGPWMTQKEVDYVTDATLNGFYENFNKHTKLLEKTFCEIVGTQHGVATHCCTLALHLACAALDLKQGDEVICTDFSWIATAYAIQYTGATPVFVDIHPDTWTIDPIAIKKAITPKTKAIMIVHSFGVPCDMDAIMTIAKEHNLKVIEDAAPALGALYKGKHVGSFGDFGCFSFQGAKLAVSGEGGIIVTNDKLLNDKVNLLASMGRTDSKAVFWADHLGYQYTIANLTAALALAQTERYKELLAKKREIFTWYDARLGKTKGIKMVREAPGTFANYCYPSLLLEDSIAADRNNVVRNLRELNIHCRPAFPRMGKMPVFEKPRFDNPVATKVEARGISLPSAMNLDKTDIDFVCDAFLHLIK